MRNICSNFSTAVKNINPVWLVYADENTSFYNLSLLEQVKTGECVGVSLRDDEIILFKHIKRISDKEWAEYAEAIKKMPSTASAHLGEDLEFVLRDDPPQPNLKILI